MLLTTLLMYSIYYIMKTKTLNIEYLNFTQHSIFKRLSFDMKNNDKFNNILCVKHSVTLKKILNN